MSKLSEFDKIYKTNDELEEEEIERQERKTLSQDEIQAVVLERISKPKVITKQVSGPNIPSIDLPWPGTDVPFDFKPFLNNRRVLVVYPGQLDYKQTAEALKKKFTVATQMYVFAKSRQLSEKQAAEIECKKGDTVTCFAIDFGKHVKKTKSDCFDLDDGGLKPLALRCVTDRQTQWNEFLAFVGREKPEKPEKKAEENIIAVIKTCKSEEEVLERLCTKSSQAIGLLTLAKKFLPKSRYDPLKDKVLAAWQEIVKEELLDVAPGRVINWFHDVIGGAGKTEFCRHIAAMSPKDVLFLPDIGSYKDMATVLYKAVETGWTGKILLVNLVRAATDHKIYKVLEGLSDGILLATKYEGGLVQWKPGHVYVFANWLPDFKKLTLSRWNVRALADMDEKVFTSWYKTLEADASIEEQGIEGRKVNPHDIRIYQVNLDQAQKVRDGQEEQVRERDANGRFVKTKEDIDKMYK